jgi:glycosyltransferase involved in cell wall biosynthesis
MYRSTVVSAIVGADPGRPARQVALDRRTAGLVDRWIANSEAAKELECDRIGMPPSKIAVVHGGIDAEYFAPAENREAKKRLLGIGASTHVVVTVANLRPMKGHEAIIRAIPGIVDRVGDTVFLFVGDDDMGGRIQAAARERGFDHHIRFLEGFLDVRPFLRAADVFVLPSTHESFPTAILEAMSMQLPVVASRVGGIPEMLTESETGFLIEPENIRGLTDAVVRLLSDPALRVQFGFKARRRVLSEFTREHMVGALQREYLSLVQLRR